ncbi:MAG: hypothetical protein QM621_13250 [Aeromicrobium sp.]
MGDRLRFRSTVGNCSKPVAELAQGLVLEAAYLARRQVHQASDLLARPGEAVLLADAVAAAQHLRNLLDQLGDPARVRLGRRDVREVAGQLVGDDGDRSPHRRADAPPGEGLEPRAPVGVEAVDGLDEPEAPLLHRVVEGVAAEAEQSRPLRHIRQSRADQLRPRLPVALTREAGQMSLPLAAQLDLAPHLSYPCRRHEPRLPDARRLAKGLPDDLWTV